MEYAIDDTLLRKGYETPVINHSPLPAYAMAGQDYGMTIGVAVTPGGRLFACWVGGGDDPKAYFLLSYSDDGGDTWTEPILAIDPHDKALPCDRSTIVGTLWLDPLGRLWLFFNQSLMHFDGRSSTWAIRCDEPDAPAPTWTEPQYIWYGTALNKPVILSTGEWMLPVALWARYHITPPFGACYHELDALRMANVLVSADEGRTWTRRGGVAFPDTRFDEHMVIERQDGTLWMVARTKDGLMESTSADRGVTWAPPRAAVIQSVSARFHLRRLRSGRVLLIKHGAPAEKAAARREELYAFLSEDDGKTWTDGRLLLDERFEVSYPDADEDRSGRLYITYDRNRARDGEILLAVLREEDILAGQAHTPGARLRQVIRRPGLLTGK